MIQIALCDDERAELDYLTALIRKWADARGTAVRVAAYESAESFLFAYGDAKEADVLLLDIQMSGMDGLELARRVRGDGGERLQLILITGYPDFAAEGYDVSALHYLIKPVKEDKFFEVLDRAEERLRKSPHTVTFRKTGGDIKLRADDIIYAEVLSHTVTLYLTDGTEELQLRISDVERALGDGFFRCHRSYIVSLGHVRRVTKTAVLLRGGKEVPLSRGLYDAAVQAFIRYN